MRKETVELLGQLLFVENTALLTASAEQLKYSVTEFGRVRKGRNYREYVEKNKFMGV